MAASMAVALVTRLPGLGHPDLLVFDELYYVPGAAEMLQWGAEHGLAKHPPLGWWSIAAGIRLFGFDPIGWRAASLVAGVATVGFVAAAVRRLTRDQRLAFIAGLLCALDGVMFTVGRLGMLDVFVGLTMSCVVWLLTLLWTSPPTAWRRQRVVEVWALAAVGLGAAVKWSMVPTVVVVLGAMWAIDRRRPSGQRFRAGALSLLLTVLIPPAVYAASWIPRQFGPAAFTPSTFVRDQRDVLDYHLGLTPADDNAAPARTWFTMSHPAHLFAQSCNDPAARTGVGPCRGAPSDAGVLILALPNPVVWAVCLLGLALVALRAVRKREAVAVGLLALVATQWLPWLINKRWAYSTYLSAIIPTLIVAAAWGVGARRFDRLRTSAVVVVALTIVMFVYFYPVWAGRVMSQAQIGARLWWWR